MRGLVCGGVLALVLGGVALRAEDVKPPDTVKPPEPPAPSKSEPAKPEPKADPAKPEPAKPDPAKPDPKPPTDKPKPKPKETPAPKPGERAKISNEAQYYLELAQVHRRFNKLDEALANFQKSAEVEKDDDAKSQILQQAGETALNDPKRSGDAAGFFEKAIAVTKDEQVKAVLYLWLGGAHRTGKEYAQAEAAFFTAYKSSSDPRMKQDAFRQFAEMLVKPERAESALAEWEKRAAEKPDDLDTLEALRVLYTQGPKPDPKKGLAVEEKLAAAHPEDHETRFRLVDRYRNAKDYPKAEALARALLKEAQEQKAPADLKPEDAKAFEEKKKGSIARAKKAIVQIYEDQGRLAELDF